MRISSMVIINYEEQFKDFDKSIANYILYKCIEGVYNLIIMIISTKEEYDSLFDRLTNRYGKQRVDALKKTTFNHNNIESVTESKEFKRVF